MIDDLVRIFILGFNHNRMFPYEIEQFLESFKSASAGGFEPRIMSFRDAALTN